LTLMKRFFQSTAFLRYLIQIMAFKEVVFK
jgi:hypothetical protein